MEFPGGEAAAVVAGLQAAPKHRGVNLLGRPAHQFGQAPAKTHMVYFDQDIAQVEGEGGDRLRVGGHSQEINSLKTPKRP